MNFIKCEKCGNELKEDSRFCNNCGNEIHINYQFCTNCGNKLNTNHKFCNNCGTSNSNYNLSNKNIEYQNNQPSIDTTQINYSKKNNKKTIIFIILGVIFLFVCILSCSSNNVNININNNKFIGSWYYRNVSNINGGITETTFIIDEDYTCKYYMDYTLYGSKIIDTNNTCTWYVEGDYIVYVTNGQESKLYYDKDEDKIYTIDKNTGEKKWDFDRITE